MSINGCCVLQWRLDQIARIFRPSIFLVLPGALYLIGNLHKAVLHPRDSQLTFHISPQSRPKHASVCNHQTSTAPVSTESLTAANDFLSHGHDHLVFTSGLLLHIAVQYDGISL